ncbi:hemagglutinin/hemolysin-like protein [Chondrocystis sp. NIES-4102]|nr:hemagglutinin/hemolysin-like protein [Chondrocystis sp. NIES-4102]
MLKYINFKNLTTCTFVAVLTAASLISQPATANTVQTCNSNNGQGNNAAIVITLSTGKTITVTQFDPSNPGNGGYIDKRIKAANPNLSTLEFAEAKNKLQQLVNDVELRGLSSSGTNCNTSSTSTTTNTGSTSTTTNTGSTSTTTNTGSTSTTTNTGSTSTTTNTGSTSIEKSITVTLEPAKTQASQLPAAETYVVNFNNRSGTAVFTETNGTTTYTYGGDLNVKNADQWGGANGSKYITQADGKNSFNIKVNQDQKYFGFWWSAGDEANKITFKNDGQEVAVFQTRDLVKFIDSKSSEQKALYYGNPAYTGTETGHKVEAFAYVNVFFNNQVYDEIVIQTLVTTGAKFESDNHTFSVANQNVRGDVLPRLATALADKVSTSEDDPTSSDDNLLSNDVGTGLSVTKINGSADNVNKKITLPSGALLIVNKNGRYTYNPNDKFDSLNQGQTATDSFTYEITDSAGNVSTATVTVTINGEDDVPVAVPDFFTTDERTPMTGDIKANDTDPNKDPLSVTKVNEDPAKVGTQVTLPSGALLTVNKNGNFTYNPNNKFRYLNKGETAKDTFTYTISDPENHSASTTVTITITGITDPTD